MNRILGIVLLWATTVGSQEFLTLENCGLSDIVQNDDRIVGGRDSVIGEYPWQVSLKFKSVFVSPTHLCGATILNDRWIITAAHCVYKRHRRNLEVTVGITSQEETDFVSYAVEEIKVHKMFDPETFLNDIAVIRVKKPISLGSGVNGICLPPVEQNVTGYATTTGWGATREDGETSSILQTVDIPLMPQNECEALFGPEHFSVSAMLCAGVPEGGIDSCQGDSGGPFIQEQDGRAVLIGIVSWGVGCARPGLPGVYTRVSNYINWIGKHAT